VPKNFLFFWHIFGTAAKIFKKEFVKRECAKKYSGVPKFFWGVTKYFGTDNVLANYILTPSVPVCQNFCGILRVENFFVFHRQFSVLKY